MSVNAFSNLFGCGRAAVIGMIHVKALPGSPRFDMSMEKIVSAAKREAEMYLDAKVDGVCIENMHDVPYLHSDRVGPETVAAMTRVAATVRAAAPSLPLGVQILAAANTQAMAVARAAGLDFVRAEGFVFSHVADEGMMNACAGPLLRYRDAISANHVLILTDIKKKHSAHAITADVDVCDTARAAQFFGSDGVILTGSATGVATSASEVKAVAAAVDIPVVIGSGVTTDNVHTYAATADALIVGSHFKKEGRWSGDLCPRRLGEFMDRVRHLGTTDLRS